MSEQTTPIPTDTTEWLTWTAILEPDRATHPLKLKIEAVRFGKVVLGSAKDFRWYNHHGQILLVCELRTNKAKWQELIGNPDEGEAVYAGPYKILRGL